MLKITHCPTCGSDKLRLVKRDQPREVKGQAYVVPELEFHECPVCGEQIYSPEAMRKIEAYSPSFAKSKRKKHAA